MMNFHFYKVQLGNFKAPFSVFNILISEVFKVTKQDILNFAETYIGSPEERADVLKSYVDGQGDLGFVIDHIMLSTEADLETWRLGNLLKREGNPN